MHVEVSQLVRAPREKVYAAYTDFESMPKWSKGVAAVRVLHSDGRIVSLQTDSVVGGEKKTTDARLVLTPPERVESERETRFTATRRLVAFDGAPEGTKVTAVLDVRVKGLWAWILSPRGREQAESNAREGLEAFANYVESLP